MCIKCSCANCGFDTKDAHKYNKEIISSGQFVFCSEACCEQFKEKQNRSVKKAKVNTRACEVRVCSGCPTREDKSCIIL